MSMAFVHVMRRSDMMEHRSRRIKCSSERPTVDAIDEGRSVSGNPLDILEIMKLPHQLVTKLIVGIEGKNPFSPDFRETKIALVCEGIEWAMNDLSLMISRDDLERSIRTSAVDNHNSPCPTQFTRARAEDFSPR